MVHDPHRVGLDEPHTEAVDEVVVVRVRRRIDREAHEADHIDVRTAGSPYWRSMTPAIRLLEASGVAYSVHEYERGEELKDFGREAAESLGLPFDQVFKTLVVDLGRTVEGSRSRCSRSAVCCR